MTSTDIAESNNENQYDDIEKNEDSNNQNDGTNKKKNRRVSVYADLESYHPGMKFRLFSPPCQRQQWGSDQILPHVNWGNLFFDLFYVAGFYNLGNVLLNDPSGIGILYFLTCFLSLLHLWNEKTKFDSQFCLEERDLYHRAFETGVLVVLGTIVSNIGPVSRMSNPTKYTDMFLFSLGLTLGIVMIAARYIECYYFGRGQRQNIKFVAKRYMKQMILPFGCYLVATILSGLAYYSGYNDDNSAYDGENYVEYPYNPYADNLRRALAEETAAGCEKGNQRLLPIVFVLIGVLGHQILLFFQVVVCWPKGGDHKKNTIPLNIGFFIHRMGELTMLVLGESVLSLLIVDGEGGSYHRTLYLGMITVVLLQLLHFQSQPHDPNAHAFRRHKNAGIAYSIIASFYFAALIAVGASYKLLLYSTNVKGYDNDYDSRRLLLVSNDHRWLAGGEDDKGCGPAGYEQQENIAYLFSGALATVFVCLELMAVAHVGLKALLGKCNYKDGVCPATGETTNGRYNIKGICFVVVPRFAITIFVASLGFWETNQAAMAGIGLAAVIGQLITRFLGDVLFFNNTDDHHHEGIVDNPIAQKEGDSKDNIDSEKIAEA